MKFPTSKVPNEYVSVFDLIHSIYRIIGTDDSSSAKKPYNLEENMVKSKRRRRHQVRKLCKFTKEIKAMK